jgi:peptidoglycan/xylan/chitin deacetylase (PgdA/CDA1 family)
MSTQGYSRPPLLETEVNETPQRAPGRRISKREMVARGLRASGLQALLLRVAPWRGVVVLSYHRVGDGSSSDTNRGLWTPEESLNEHLQFLKRRCQVIDPQELADPEMLSSRGRRVMVTFDDGYRDLYEVAFPLLQANGVVATMFVCSGFLDGSASAWWDEIAWMLHHSPLSELPPGPWSSGPLSLGGAAVEHAIDVATRSYWELPAGDGEQFLAQLGSVAAAGRRPRNSGASDWITWEMAREMQAAGQRIGAHTMSHPILGRLPRQQQLEEIGGSADRIEAELGERPRTLAYPVGLPGMFNDDSRAAAHDAGIELAFSNYGGRVERSSFRPLDVRRVSAETLRTPELFAASLALPQLFVRLPG